MVKANLDKIDIENIINYYKTGRFSMKTLGSMYHTSHHRIRDILIENGIEILSKFRNINKENIDYKIMYRTSIRSYAYDKISLYKNMKAHLRFDVSLEWLMQFDDIDKIKVLNKAISDRKGRWGNDSEWYKSYIEKFYYDDKYNKIYNAYIESGFDDYLRPSLDHIVPKSAKGTNDINNLRFVTWFENRAKNNMSLERWEYIKANIHRYLI